MTAALVAGKRCQPAAGHLRTRSLFRTRQCAGTGDGPLPLWQCSSVSTQPASCARERVRHALKSRMCTEGLLLAGTLCTCMSQEARVQGVGGVWG